MTMNSKAFDTEFRLCDSGSEPTIRRMIQHYYTSNGIDLGPAKELADRVVDAALLVSE
jgi:hypothetical protein